MPTYRVGIVGCGARSTAHAKGWVGNEGVAIAAVADPIQERRDALGGHTRRILAATVF